MFLLILQIIESFDAFLSVFKFHYVSINSEIRPEAYEHEYTLNSIMFLLIRL